jgi:O-antigen/teichoic acid export membrane protein
VNGAAESRLVKRIAFNSGVQVAGVLGGSALSFVTFAAVSRYLGPQAFGYYSAALALLLVPSIVSDLGLSTTVLRDISRTPELTSRVVSGSITASAVVGSVAFAATLGISWLAPFPHEMRMVALIAVAGSLLLLLNNRLLPALQAELRMQWAVLANVAGRSLTLALTLVALNEKLGLYAVVVAYVAGNALTLAIDFLVVRRRVALRLVLDTSYCWKLARNSMLVGAALIAGSLYFRIDVVLLAALRPAREVGLYAAAYKFLDLSLLVVAAISVSVFPHLTRVIARGEDIEPAVQRMFDVLLALGAGISVVAFVHADHLVRLASGRQFESGAAALQILAPAVVVAFVCAVFERILLAAHRELLLLAVSGAIFVANVAMNVILVPAYGYKAAAATTLASEVLWVLLAAWVVRRSVGVSPAPSFAPHVATAAAIMAAILVLVPGPWPLLELVAGLSYLLVLAVLPGPGWKYVLAVLPLPPRRQAAS